MDHIFTLSELDTSLVDVVANVPAFYANSSNFFAVLYATGCRPIEACEIGRWSKLIDDSYRLRCAKGSMVRVFAPGSLPHWFDKYIIANYLPYSYVNYHRFCYSFAKSYAYPLAYVGRKQSGLYLFRYRKFKQLAADGYSIADISDIMGESSNAVTGGYLSAQIWSGG